MQSLSRSRLMALLAIALIAVFGFALAFRFCSPEVGNNASKEESEAVQLGVKSKKEGPTTTAEDSMQSKKTRRKRKARRHKTQRKQPSDGERSEVVTPSEEDNALENLSSLSGKVLDVWTGAGVANAEVSLDSHNPSAARNKKGSQDTKQTAEGLNKVRALSNGAFLLTNIRYGDYRLRVAAHAYAEKTYPIWIPPGRAINGLRFYLEPSYTISGRVTDERYNPIMKAIVRTIYGEKKTKTRHDGAYTLEVPSRRNYNLLFEAKGYGSTRLYDIPAGSSDIDVVFYPAGSISGKVIDGETDLPVLGARINAFIQAVKSSRDKLAVTRSDKNGNYTIPDVASGHYLLRAQHRDKTSPIQAVGVKQSEHTRDVNLELLRVGSISGQITEKGTGNSVPNITVLANTNRILYTRAVSRDDGTYRLTGLGPGEYFLQPQTSTGDVVELAEESPMNWMSRVFVSTGSNTTDADFIVVGTSSFAEQLRPPAQVSGQVVDQNDNGVAGAKVLLGFPASTLSGGRLLSNTSTLSDERGRFSFDNVNGKRVALRVQHPQYERNSIELTLKSGEDKRNVKVPLKARTTTGISGRVTDTKGNAIAAARVWVWGQGYSPIGTTDAEGRYALVDISSGEYDVKAEKKGYKTIIIRDVTVSANEIKRAVDFQLTPTAGHYIAGEVIDEQGIPIPGALVTPYGRRGYGRGMTQTDIRGAFKITGLEDRTYSIAAKDWTATRQEITIYDIEVDTEDLRIVLKRSTGGMSGKVVDKSGQPIRRFNVAYSNRTGKRERSGATSLYSLRGEFLIEGLEAGEYQVEIVDGENQNRKTLEGISVEEGKITSGVVVEMPDGISVSGEVVDLGGVPVRGALVCAGGLRAIMGLAYEKERGISNPYMRYTSSGPDGSFHLANLSDGTTSIGAYHPDYAPGEVNFDRPVNRGTVSGLSIVLDQGGDLSGIVRDTTGAPIAGISVYAQPGFRSAETDANGSFRFGKLAPIKYTIEARRRTSSVWKKMTVKGGEEAHIELILGETDN